MSSCASECARKAESEVRIRFELAVRNTTGVTFAYLQAFQVRSRLRNILRALVVAGVIAAVVTFTGANGTWMHGHGPMA